MQNDNKNEENQNLSNTPEKTNDEIKNRSIRWSDSVYEKQGLLPKVRESL